MLEQLDLRIDVQPKVIGPFAFGTATHVTNGSTRKPGVFGITQIQIKPGEDDARLRELTRPIMQEIAEMPGFISSTTSLTSEGFATTLTAWEDMEAAKNAVAGSTHKLAMQAFFEQDGLGESAWTSFWTDGQLNKRWQRCGECKNMTIVTDSQTCKCGAPLTNSAWY